MDRELFVHGTAKAVAFSGWLNKHAGCSTGCTHKVDWELRSRSKVRRQRQNIFERHRRSQKAE